MDGGLFEATFCWCQKFARFYPVLTFYFSPKTGKIQEYDYHLGAVNTVTFIDEGRRFVSTSDDKTIRVGCVLECSAHGLWLQCTCMQCVHPQELDAY